jgi:hypothetical protein
MENVKNKLGVKGALRITGLFTLRPFGARATKNRSRPMAFVRFFSATFWPAAMLRIALWAGQNVVNSRNVMRNNF